MFDFVMPAVEHDDVWNVWCVLPRTVFDVKSRIRRGRGDRVNESIRGKL